jgi:hypothetical protein
MPAYFTCSLCRRISVMHQLKARCPACGSRSGEISSDRPQAGTALAGLNKLTLAARRRKSRTRRSGARDRRMTDGDRRSLGGRTA